MSKIGKRNGSDHGSTTDHNDVKKSDNTHELRMQIHSHAAVCPFAQVNFACQVPSCMHLAGLKKHTFAHLLLAPHPPLPRRARKWSAREFEKLNSSQL